MSKNTSILNHNFLHFIRFDGDFFPYNLDRSVERSTRQGKGPQCTGYIQYCSWAHVSMVKVIRWDGMCCL